MRLGSPKYEHAISDETVWATSSWHLGFGQGRYGTPEMYAVANGVDGSVPGLLVLAPSPSLVDSTLTNVRAWGIFAGQLYAGNGSALMRWTGTAFASVGTTAAAITSLQEFSPLTGSPKLYVGQQTGNYYTYDGTTLSAATTPGRHFVAVNEFLWRSRSSPSAVAKSSDGVTWSGDVLVGSGGEDITGLLVYNSRVFVLTSRGIWAVARDGTSENLLPQYAVSPQPDLGRGSGVHNDIVYVPLGGTLLEWQEGTVTATGTGRRLAATEPLAPSLGSIVRGTWAAVTGVSGHVLMALMNTADGCYVLLRRPPQEPGFGWHPIALIPNVQGLSIFAEGVTDATAINVWIGTTGGVYQLRWPRSDLPHLEQGWPLATSGTIDLSALDLGMPSFAKLWLTCRVTGTVPAGARVSVYYQVEMPVGWQLLGSIDGYSAGTHTFTFPPQLLSSWLQLRLVLERQAGAATPAITEVAVTAEPNPGHRMMWQLGVLIGDEASPSQRHGLIQQVTELFMLHHSRMVVPYQDLDGRSWSVVLDEVSAQEILKEGGQAALYQASLQLKSARPEPVRMAMTYDQLSEFTYSGLGIYTYGALAGE